jgi:hypothetical protein
MTTRVKVHMLCPHAFQMAMQSDTDVRIEGAAPAEGEVQGSVQPLSVGLCEGCGAALAADLRKRKFKVTIIRPKHKEAPKKKAKNAKK